MFMCILSFRDEPLFKITSIHSFIDACLFDCGVKNGREIDAFSVEFVLIVVACIHMSLCVCKCGHFDESCLVCQEF